ncbi:hypothetical protein AMD27_17535 (plasmid) [Acinetobacter sp. TGL-Y2]|uniref:hypothetical protein n=1 Tax=Acinetobacter sp. TGL-Y2 TaxID=1407071 RepID=UPI0007A67354|nr:hypothetical protein [Acinetobacter sp. TGL-Y2]AMW80719.1 hypothetical protein AMD27_17535 [Acinetobacter sp. TGL-Y2]
MKFPLTLLSLFLCVGLTHAEDLIQKAIGPSDQEASATAKNFYDRKAEGWYWYQYKKEVVQNKGIPPKKVIELEYVEKMDIPPHDSSKKIDDDFFEDH